VYASIYTNAPEVQQIAKAVSRLQRTEIFSILRFTANEPLILLGQRLQNVLCYHQLKTMRAEPIPQGGSGHGDVPYRLSTLPIVLPS